MIQATYQTGTLVKGPVDGGQYHPAIKGRQVYVFSNSAHNNNCWAASVLTAMLYHLHRSKTADIIYHKRIIKSIENLIKIAPDYHSLLGSNITKTLKEAVSILQTFKASKTKLSQKQLHICTDMLRAAATLADFPQKRDQVSQVLKMKLSIQQRQNTTPTQPNYAELFKMKGLMSFNDLLLLNRTKDNMQKVKSQNLKQLKKSEKKLRRLQKEGMIKNSPSPLGQSVPVSISAIQNHPYLTPQEVVFLTDICVDVVYYTIKDLLVNTYLNGEKNISSLDFSLPKYAQEALNMPSKYAINLSPGRILTKEIPITETFIAHWNPSNHYYYLVVLPKGQ